MNNYFCQACNQAWDSYQNYHNHQCPQSLNQYYHHGLYQQMQGQPQYQQGQYIGGNPQFMQQQGLHHGQINMFETNVLAALDLLKKELEELKRLIKEK